MSLPVPTYPGPSVRVLVVSHTGSAISRLVSWLDDLPGVAIYAPLLLNGETIAPTHSWQPNVVILDFETVAGSLMQVIADFKRHAPTPHVFVLAHDTSAVLRRRCQEAGADAVFDRTADLELLRNELAARARPAHANGVARSSQSTAHPDGQSLP